MQKVMEKQVLAERFNAARVKCGMTYQDVADATGLAKSMINAIVSGRTNLSTESAVAIARTLNVTVDWLLGNDETSISEVAIPVYSMTVDTTNGPLQIFSRRPLNEAFRDALVDAARCLAK